MITRKISTAKLVVVFIFSVTIVSGQSFKESQLRFPRVKNAFDERSPGVDTLLNRQQIKKDQLEIFVRAFKQEQSLEVWGKNRSETKFKLITTYPFCAISGTLGPKRKEGDGQIPEGVYYINHFNPRSNFHLSLGINYPNRSDAVLGVKGKLGNAIYIHGDCVTIGCIPITDDLIKELYVIAVEAANNGQKEIPVHIFPAHLTDPQIEILKESTRNDSTKVKFWENLAEVYRSFEKSLNVPSVSIDKHGMYILK